MSSPEKKNVRGKAIFLSAIRLGIQIAGNVSASTFFSLVESKIKTFDDSLACFQTLLLQMKNGKGKG